MPKINFSMLLPPAGEENHQPVLFKCKKCGELMQLDEIDSHAKIKHNATSASVDTTINHN